MEVKSLGRNYGGEGDRSRVCEVGVKYMGLMNFFFQAEDGIRDLVRSRGLGDVYKRQGFILLVINRSYSQVSL